MNFLNEPRKYDVKTSGSPEQLSELLVCLMFRMHPVKPGGGDIQIVAGVVPDNLKDKVPMPGGSRVVGSSLSKQANTVVLETALPGEQVKRFYERRMAELGWTKPQPMMGVKSGGFENQLMESMLGVTYSKGDNDPTLTIKVNERSNGLTNVFLTYQPSGENPMFGSRGRKGAIAAAPMMPHSLLPNLSPPGTDVQLSGGRSASNGQERSSAQLRSDRSIEEIATHYEAQLGQAGWVQTRRKEEGAISSAYTLKDEYGMRWTAFFSVMDRLDMDGYFYLVLEATKVTDDGPDIEDIGEDFIMFNL